MTLTLDSTDHRIYDQELRGTYCFTGEVGTRSTGILRPMQTATGVASTVAYSSGDTQTPDEEVARNEKRFFLLFFLFLFSPFFFLSSRLIVNQPMTPSSRAASCRGGRKSACARCASSVPCQRASPQAHQPPSLPVPPTAFARGGGRQWRRHVQPPAP